MDKISVGVLTVSDRCFGKEAVDESGPNLVSMIRNGVIKNGGVEKTSLVSDCKEDIENILRNWCDDGIHLILTTGGTGIAERDVTPEATMSVVTKTIPGISGLILKRSLEATPLGALSRGVAGIKDKTLIINLPGSKKASRECLLAVAEVIPHAVDVITGKKTEIERVHSYLGSKTSLVKSSPDFIKGKSPYPLVTVSSAQLALKNVHLLRKKRYIDYKYAVGYVLAEDVIAKDDLPPFDVSLKDGYAILTEGNYIDKLLKVIGVSRAGQPPLDVKVERETCVKISTGACMPPGANAVVQVEDTKLNHDDSQKEGIYLNKSVQEGQDIRRKGSDFARQERVLKQGTYLDASAVGLLAAVGANFVRVFDKPLVAVMSTGDELVEPDAGLSPGKVRDSNRITLINLLQKENFKVVDLGIVPDNPNALLNSLERGFQMADVVVTTGSMSMGERDYLKEVLIADFNAEILFGRVLMKPGKPTSAATLMFEEKPKLWFGLPGNPASAYVTFHLFVLPTLKLVSGIEETYSTVTTRVSNPPPLEDRPHYVRAVLTYNEVSQSFTATVTGNQSSSRIGSCVSANCLLEFPQYSGSVNCINVSDTVVALLTGKILFET